jgi:RNA polymerase sigma factor (sigma-70 family)
MLMATMTELMPAPSPAVAAEDSDDALVRASCAGDMAAFEALYRRHVGRIHGVILRLVGGHHARAEDLTQDAFVRAWQALPSYRFESAFGTWLYRLAANTALMELRRRRSQPSMEADDGYDGIGTVDTAGQTMALSTDLERVVASLPPRARAVLVLHDVEGWKHEEIAAQLDMAVGSSKAQLHRARMLLRTRLGGEA